MIFLVLAITIATPIAIALQHLYGFAGLILGLIISLMLGFLAADLD